MFSDLAITGGHAAGGGVLGGPAPLGGTRRCLIDGGHVTLSQANVAGNFASGATGAKGIGRIDNGESTHNGSVAATAATAPGGDKRKGVASTSRPAN